MKSQPFLSNAIQLRAQKMAMNWPKALGAIIIRYSFCTLLDPTQGETVRTVEKLNENL